MPETPDPEPVQQAQPPRKASQVKTYEFTSELETGNELIDSEHKELIDAINNLLLACGEGKGRGEIRKTLEFLNDYIAYHFSDEEKLQRQYGYPDYENHKRYHEEYKRIVAGILNEFEQGGSGFQDESGHCRLAAQPHQKRRCQGRCAYPFQAPRLILC